MTDQEKRDIILLGLEEYKINGRTSISKILKENDVEIPFEEQVKIIELLKNQKFIEDVKISDKEIQASIHKDSINEVRKELHPKYQHVGLNAKLIRSSLLSRSAIKEDSFRIVEANRNKVEVQLNLNDSGKPPYYFIGELNKYTFKLDMLPNILESGNRVSTARIRQVFEEWANAVASGSAIKNNEQTVHHVLSSNPDSQTLGELGFHKQGIAAYVLSSEGPGTILLNQYSSGLNSKKFFYSAFPDDEDLEGHQLELRTTQETWYVLENQAEEALPLRRYYNRNPSPVGDHFYALNPLDETLKSLGYIEETVQGFVFSKPGEGRVPLYLYSTNKERVLFKPLVEQSKVYKYDSNPSLITSPSEPLLGVKDLAQIFTNLILSSFENGQMQEQFYGIFGRWGRGKTFFWSECKKIFCSDRYKDKIIPIEFHAWKYQDTPAIWAYLYEKIAKVYYEGHRGLFHPLHYMFFLVSRRLKINFSRVKFLTVLLFILGIGLLFSVPAEFYKNFEDNRMGSDGAVAFLLSIMVLLVPAIDILRVSKFSQFINAKDFINLIFKRGNFDNHLGVQHEVEKELSHLINCFVKDDQVIVLFVDDIDRCSETKIVEIVDSLRVMLDDREIRRKVIVIAAIDERILKLAINHKYHDLLGANEGPELHSKLNRTELVREYLDKLFLTGLKLNELTLDEKREFLDGLHKGIIEKKSVRKPSTEEEKVSAQVSTETPAQGQAITEQPEESEPLKVETIKQELEQEEHHIITEAIVKKDLNPRAIRAISTRYRLGKKLLERAIENDEVAKVEWNKGEELDVRRIFAELLVAQSLGENYEAPDSPIKSYLEKVASMVTPY